MKKLYSILKLAALILLINSWNSTLTYAHFGSKGPFGGTPSCMIVNDSTVYIGTENGGVFESVNSQILSWRARPVGLKSGKITALTHTGSYLFSSTADSGIYRFTGYVGSDRYWEQVNNGLTQLSVKSLVSIDSITVLAGTDGDGLFKTEDNGANWNAINSVHLNGQIITAMLRAGSRIFLLTEAGGVFMSDDDGDTWNDFNDVNTQGMPGNHVMSYNSATDELIILNHMGLFIAGSVSTTANPVYTSANTGFSSLPVIRSISTDGTNWYLASDDGVYSTAAASINWTMQSSGLSTQDVNALVCYQNILIAGTNGDGIYKTPSASVAWVSVNTNFNNQQTYAMFTKDSTLVVAATEKGVFVSTNLASSYTPSNNGLTDSLYVSDLCFFGNTLMASTHTGGVYISQDTGMSWNAFNTNLMMMDISKLFASDLYAYLIDANGNVFQSDLSASWTLIQTGLPLAAMPTSMAFYGGNILLGTYGDGVFMRPEASGSWTAINTGLTDLNVTSVTTNTTNLFAGTDGNGVFTSEIASLNWSATAPTSISHTTLIGLDGTKIQAMATYAGYVFASYLGGLLATSDNGQNWIAGGNQFNLPSYTNVKKITFVTTRVFVSTDYNCLYSNSLSELPVITGISGPESNFNNDLLLSPNPSNGSFEVKLMDQKGSIKAIKLFDGLGKLVYETETIVMDNNLKFDFNIPSGIYFLQVNTGEKILSKKIVIN
ncbi:MAG TPA: T9SS type A sorting domain-containing protein [Bacteroidia bacterium]|nr:T9SS type A sorting domain-containing protein [Bacteroidia bacterium]HNS12579.1 T9SS type A sorting domain-containing protein [Bacteroidia bacterium]